MKENFNSGGPATIEELRDYCVQRGISLYQINFYLGSDHIGSNAHGIYKDYWSNDFITYRNVEDGSKEVIYQGQDEAAAVKVIFGCLLQVLNNTGAQDIAESGSNAVFDRAEEKIYGENEDLNSSEANKYGSEPGLDIAEETLNSFEESEYSKAGTDSFGESIFKNEETSDSHEESIFRSEETLDSHEESIFRSEEASDSHEESIFKSESNSDSHEESIFKNESNSDSYVESIYRTDSNSSLFGASTYNTQKSTRSDDDSSLDSSWMNIMTPLMKAAPNENADEKSEKEKYVYEDAFGIEDVKDLKTGIVYFFSKLTYYLSRGFYYISVMIFALSRVFIAISQYLGQRVLELDKSESNEKVTKDSYEKIKSAAQDYNFDEKEYDDKVQLVWDITKFYTGKLFLHISKLSFRFSRYCCQSLDIQGNTDKDKNADAKEGTINKPVTANDVANKPAINKDVINKQVTTNDAVNKQAANNAATNKPVTTKEDISKPAAKEATSSIVRETSEENTYYAGSQKDIQTLVKKIDPDVEILKAESTYDLSEIADEYDDEDDNSLDSLNSSLDEDNFDYSDYNDDYVVHDLENNIGRFLVLCLFVIIFLIFMLAKFDADSKSQNRYDYHSSYHSSYSHDW